MYYHVNITVLFHDAIIQSVYDVKTPSDVLNLKPKGNGGTSHECVWQWINDNKPNPRLVVCLTDGFTSFGNNPLFNVIWVVPSNGNNAIPFGKVIRMFEE